MKVEFIEDAAFKEPHITIRCATADNPEIKQLLSKLTSKNKQQLLVTDTDSRENVILLPTKMLYAEIVDRHIYLYTADHVYETHLSLAEMADTFKEYGFFRCSKTMVVNLYAICRLKSVMSGRIMAELLNGEKILIARRYAALLRTEIEK